MADPDAPARSRLVTWDDPMATAAAGRGMTGLAFLTALTEGSLPPPPIMRLMQMAPVSVEEGSVTFRAEPDESQYNPIGAVHGGVVCTLLDSVVGCAVHTTLPLGFGYTSVEIKVSYLRAVSGRGGALTATGTVVKPGRRIAFAEGSVTDEQGRLVATASSTLLVFPLPA
jgi:uncharacterized protein (TIGR00369 family)